MNRLLPAFVLQLAVVLAAPAAWARPHLRISGNAAAIDGFENWTSASPWDQITRYHNGNAARPVVDLLLQLQALKAAGYDFDFEFTRTLTYDLAEKEVLAGRADLTAESIWDSDIAVHAGALLHTDPLIRDGEFVKGIYVPVAKRDSLPLQGPEDLKALRGAVVGTWTLDVACLQGMGLKSVIMAVTPEVVFTRIQQGAADFTLAEFSSAPDLSVHQGAVTLVPIPGCKVALRGSRSYIISKGSPEAAALQRALQDGLRILRANGTIERAFTESGFFDQRVAGWKRLF